MSTSRWKRIEKIFRRAAELHGEERAAYLERQCEGDQRLLREVQALLEHDEAGSGDSIAEAVRGAMGTGMGQAGTEASGFAGPGDMVGPYRLEREIGRGGMGAVYLAVRADDQFSKQVAIKLMRPRRGRPDLLQRFQTERQILATLEHPNIARMLDGGSTEAGEPYVVMEYVEGESLTAYCNQRRLGTEERLRLFRSVCAAVQHAHRSLVVHRDLKPGNIFVTREGEVKLLDFGIAKLLDPQMSPVTLAETATEHRLLTPEYASPEQIKGEGITTATDVYSLGVVLYELLSGRKPYRLRRVTTGELERAVVEQVPERPSTAITREEPEGTTGRRDDAETISRERGTAPESLRRRLSGDLDNIVLMALRKEPERRYASAEALAEDIRRHLEELPVSARAATFRYRARKFVARHAGALTGVAAVVALVASLVGFYTVQVSNERRRAELEARTNARVSEFLVGLFQQADPRKAAGEEVTARELLDRGVESVEGELSEAPEIQARLLATMSTAYWNMGRHEQALELLDRALALQERIPGDRRAEESALLRDRAGILVGLARYDEAGQGLERALDLGLRVHDPGSEAVSRVRREMGLVAERKGEFEKAERIFAENVEVARRLSGDDDTLYLSQTLLDLGRLIMLRGRHDEAIGHLEESVRIQEKLLPEVSAERSEGLNLLGAAYYRIGDHDRAEPLYREALALSRRIYGVGSPDSAYNLTNLGNLYKARGQPVEAEPYLREALKIRLEKRGAEHPETTSSLNNLANVLQDQGEFGRAEPLLRQALDIQRKLHGARHPVVATTLNNLASLLHRVGRYAEAEEMFRETLAIDLETLGADHEYVAMDYANLAGLLNETERYAEVDELLEQALGIQEDNPNVAPFNLSSTLVVKARALMKRDRYEEAEPVLRRAVALREESLAGDSLPVANARSLLGECIFRQGGMEESRSLLEAGWKIIRSALPAGHGERREPAERLIELYVALGEEGLAAEVRAELDGAEDTKGGGIEASEGEG